MSTKPEHALRKAELSAILASAMDAIIAIDESQRIVLFNASAASMFGCSADDALGSHIERFIPPRFREKHREHVERFGCTGTTSRRMGALGNVHGLRENGEEFPLEASIAQVEAGSQKLFAVVLRDLTDRHRMEQAQREAQQDAEFLAAIVASSSDAIIGRTLDGTIVTWNRAAEEIFGYSSAEVVGRSVSILFPEDRMAEHPEIMDRVRVGETVRRFETLRLRKDGTPIDVSISACPVLDSSGNVAAAAVLLHDITEQRRAREAEADLARIIEESLNEIYVCDAHTLRFLAVNRGARENLGYSLEEVLGLTVLDLKSELSREQFEALVAPLRSGNREKVEFETTHRRKDGSLYPVEVHVQRGRYRGAESFVAVIMDVSERKATAEREREAERRARRLEALASISTLTAGIAHDVGAPMTAILGYAEMLEKSLSDEKNRRRAQIIIEQIHRISELVQALLNMARPGERGFVSLDLSKILEASLEFYREKLRAHGVVVERSIDSVPDVAGDPDRLQQLFLNLIINAVDAMPKGGTLRIVLTNPDAEVVEVRVRDSGTGIDPEKVDRVFEPFYTTKERGQGTGLGLVVAKAIIDEHSGEIAVDSEVGGGTEFVIRFPTVCA